MGVCRKRGCRSPRPSALLHTPGCGFALLCLEAAKLWLAEAILMQNVGGGMWVVVKILVPFWVLSIIRHLVFRGPKKGP